MVFPIGARIREIAADHLDRLPGKSLVDGLVHKRSVAEDDHARCTDEPEQRRKGRRDEAERHGDDEETGVELGGGSAEGANLEVPAVQAADDVHAGNDEDDDEGKKPVGQQRVDAEHGKDHGIVARVAAQVVIDAGLDLAKVGGLADTLVVEELGERPQVGEAAAEVSRRQAGEAVLKVQARRQGVEGDLNASHCVGLSCWNRGHRRKSRNWRIALTRSRVTSSREEQEGFPREILKSF